MALGMFLSEETERSPSGRDTKIGTWEYKVGTRFLAALLPKHMQSLSSSFLLKPYPHALALADSMHGPFPLPKIDPKRAELHPHHSPAPLLPFPSSRSPPCTTFRSS